MNTSNQEPQEMIQTAQFFIVDDNAPFRTALREFLEQELAQKVSGEATNGVEALANDMIYTADIIIMDIMMKEMDGINAARRLLWEFPNLKILAVTASEDSIFLRQLVHTGFYGCVFKSQLFKDLPDAIHNILEGRRYYPQSLKL
ncbi:two-component system invasion response regulator UvrY [Breznakibacter xylanolyticus]|uniref:Two-component system invasion response regulator UvrY n=1 Tax=Breznakibacter xylanolyticus TaxID=990 RepID=A0A2W7NE17_9BACT|nr:response regulator transcription factor [Breznakibacter xylanolyticus]PZX18170.1 two-component system invasion response regulator UvrY [Breznakibacter xylanolyticus]